MSLAANRLPFTLPPFTRVMWVSAAARDVWTPRLDAIARIWSEIEWRAVEAGVYDATVKVVSAEQMLEQSGMWLEHGLAVLPLEVEAAQPPPLDHPSRASSPSSGFRVAVGGVDALKAFRIAFNENDDATIGRLLGHPLCCTTSLRRTWVHEGLTDTTWPMAEAANECAGDRRELTVSGSPEGNILWRWVGVRAVPHLPCCSDCAPTIALGRRLLHIGRRLGHAQVVNWMLEILSWPVEWSALHGIAEIRTPILKITTQTDATTVTYVVRRTGDAYPKEGARGLRFPYRMPERSTALSGAPLQFMTNSSSQPGEFPKSQTPSDGEPS